MCHRQLSHSNNQIIQLIIYLSRDTGIGCPHAHDKSATTEVPRGVCVCVCVCVCGGGCSLPIPNVDILGYVN